MIFVSKNELDVSLKLDVLLAYINQGTNIFMTCLLRYIYIACFFFVL